MRQPERTEAAGAVGENRPRSGRPRDTGIDTAVLASALSLLAEVGYSRMSMAAIAERAGVHKPSVYRRWGSKLELTVDAVTESLAMAAAPPDTGSLEGDLRELYRNLIQLVHGFGGRVLGAVVAELPFNPELARVYRRRGLRARRDAMVEILERARRRGEVRSDADLLFAADIGPSMITHRVMVSGDRLDDRFLDELVTLVLRYLQLTH